MLKGRLGLVKARIPHADRHGLLWLGRGKLSVEDGCLRFVTTGSGDLKEGVYQIPFQNLSFLLLGPGTTVSHDALRLLARHQTGLLAVGENGVRFYASMPFGPDDSTLARKQATLWANEATRSEVARAMFIKRFGTTRNPATLPHDLNALRGLEGQRVRALYKQLSKQYGLTWTGRRYDRQNPEKTDLMNQAINHAATAVKAAAMVAVSITGTLAPLGFVHEASGQSFALDIADLHRGSLVLPIAFEALKMHEQHPHQEIERITRKLAGEKIQGRIIIPQMINQIKELLGANDTDRDP